MRKWRRESPVSEARPFATTNGKCRIDRKAAGSSLHVLPKISQRSVKVGCHPVLRVLRTAGLAGPMARPCPGESCQGLSFLVNYQLIARIQTQDKLRHVGRSVVEIHGRHNLFPQALDHSAIGTFFQYSSSGDVRGQVTSLICRNELLKFVAMSCSKDRSVPRILRRRGLSMPRNVATILPFPLKSLDSFQVPCFNRGNAGAVRRKASSQSLKVGKYLEVATRSQRGACSLPVDRLLGTKAGLTEIFLRPRKVPFRESKVIGLVPAQTFL